MSRLRFLLMAVLVTSLPFAGELMVEHLPAPSTGGNGAYMTRHDYYLYHGYSGGGRGGWLGGSFNHGYSSSHLSTGGSSSFRGGGPGARGK